jgi:hypothetical protein
MVLFSNFPSDCRCVIMWHASTKKSTTLAAAELQDKRHALRHRIDRWHDVQQIYLPCIQQLLAPTSPPFSNAAPSSDSSPIASSHTYNVEKPETAPLFLPSSISSSLQATDCAPGLQDKERRLHHAQADDGLHELRRQLRISATLRDYKQVQVGGTSQKMNTRMQTLLSRFCDKTMRCAERYNAARQALNPKSNLRSPRRDEDNPGESRRELSWIWLVSRDVGTMASMEEINDSKSLFAFSFSILCGDPAMGLGAEYLRYVTHADFCYLTAMSVKWAKTKARADRWSEEVLLVTEEMR